MSLLQEWQIKVTDNLHLQKLVGWVTPIEDGGIETIAGDEPDKSNTVAWKAWANDYMYVAKAMEMSLGTMRASVLNHPRYQQLPRWHPIMARYYVVGSLIKEMAQSSLATPYSSTPNPTHAGHDHLAFQSPQPSSSARPTGPSPSLFAPAPTPTRRPSPTPLPNSQAAKRVKPVATGQKMSQRYTTFKNPASTMQSSTLQSFAKNPSTHPDWCPVTQSIGPVFMPLKPMESSIRKELRKQVSSRDQWGDRCARCGSTLVHGQPGYHRTYDCITATAIKCTTNAPIMTRWVNQPSPRHLLVNSGPQAGSKICFEYNIRRTMNAVCYELNCSLKHACSLCFSPDHRALDCGTHTYLPQLPKRPFTLYPANVKDCRDQWVAKSIANKAAPPAYRLKPLNQSLAPPTPPTQSTPTPVPAHASSSSSSALRYKVVDAWWDAVPRPALPIPTGVQVPPRSAALPHPEDPIKENLDIVDGSADMHVYPLEVPYCVQPRPRYYSRIPLAEIRDKVPNSWLSGFDQACQNASRLVSHEDVDFGAMHVRDNRFKVKIFDIQQSVYGISASKFDIPNMRKVGEKRYQPVDGCCHAAAICFLMHYPPPHNMPFAFTPSKDASGMLLKGGLSSPVLTGNWGICYENAVPLFFEVDQTGNVGWKSHSQPISKYDSGIIKLCVNHRAEEIVERASKGISQWLFTFGETPGDVVDKVVALADASEFLETKTIEWQCREPRDWELGVVCLRTMLLGQFHHSTKRKIDANGVLFDSVLDAREASYVLDDQSKDIINPISVIFTLLRDVTQPNSCIVTVKADHPTYATQFFNHPELSIGITLDLIISLAEDLFFDRFTTQLFPPPTWRFTHRKKNATLFANVDKSDAVNDDYPDQSLSPAHQELLKSLDTHQKKRQRPINPDALPKVFRDLYRSATLVPDPNGINIDPNDPVAIILHIDSNRRARRKSPNPTQSTLASAPPRPPDTLPPVFGWGGMDTFQNGVPYESICECGQRSMSSSYKVGTDTPVLVVMKVTKSGAHKPSAAKPLQSECIMGIPTSSLGDALKCCIRQGVRSKKVNELGGWKDRVTTAFQIHVG